MLGHTDSVTYAAFPEFIEEFAREDNVTYPVQFNGKMRFTVELPRSASPAEAEESIRAMEQTARYVADKQIVKFIVVPGRIVNIVIK